MTFAILARDQETGALGGAAATGSLCVGGWVLRGRLGPGLSASQGAAPSTFWGEDVLDRMADGLTASDAVQQITDADSGRASRQLSALDMAGNTGAFTGDQNQPSRDALAFDGGIAAGNMLAGEHVLTVLAEAFTIATGPLDTRLLAALHAANAAGGDFRGLQSAAMLVLHPDHPPLTLRVDYQPDDPLGALSALHRQATTGEYATWARQVPVATDKERVLD
ncbi:DUF1028 domain-containing protein [Palleronia caenipelagi]|uniref:DUF1028 domain-containing protein n=1 Tax=Palleronia caenipelagi TaxID=2489174 RepID=A0A547PPN2_9RHOB|nr:DUF1028 domain-containing protein [Palleronia caenipelagi]TRD15994.1 DUF1028 domain-containing protein [Palleronia caenipelagi]